MSHNVSQFVVTMDIDLLAWWEWSIALGEEDRSGLVSSFYHNHHIWVDGKIHQALPWLYIVSMAAWAEGGRWRTWLWEILCHKHQHRLSLSLVLNYQLLLTPGYVLERSWRWKRGRRALQGRRDSSRGRFRLPNIFKGNGHWKIYSIQHWCTFGIAQFASASAGSPIPMTQL